MRRCPLVRCLAALAFATLAAKSATEAYLLIGLTVRHASAGGVFDQTRSRNNLSARVKRICKSMSII